MLFHTDNKRPKGRYFIAHKSERKVVIMAAAGVSTLGILFGYSAGTYDTKPSSFTLLTRINAIGGIALETEQIDASALED